MKDFLICISVVMFIALGIFTCNVIGKSTDQLVQSTHTDAPIVYEEFQSLYNTCTKINTDLGNMQAIPVNDKMFEQFSKAQRINTLKTNMNRWVVEYNTKSKTFGRVLWKSNSLPYELNVTDFSNYNK